MNWMVILVEEKNKENKIDIKGGWEWKGGQ